MEQAAEPGPLGEKPLPVRIKELEDKIAATPPGPYVNEVEIDQFRQRLEREGQHDPVQIFAMVEKMRESMIRKEEERNAWYAELASLKERWALEMAQSQKAIEVTQELKKHVVGGFLSEAIIFGGLGVVAYFIFFR